jgi:hypothetical protein
VIECRGALLIDQKCNPKAVIGQHHRVLPPKGAELLDESGKARLLIGVFRQVPEGSEFHLRKEQNLQKVCLENSRHTSLEIVDGLPIPITRVDTTFEIGSKGLTPQEC